MRKLAIVCVFLVAAGCSGGGDGAGGVEMTSAQAFQPETITIHVGDEVTWTNGSSEHHTVTADGSSLPDGADYFASGGAATEEAAEDDLSDGLLGPGESYSHTFDTPGTYRYFCIPHRGAGMVGTVVVEES
jgi:plastocyanin